MIKNEYRENMSYLDLIVSKQAETDPGKPLIENILKFMNKKLPSFEELRLKISLK